MKKGNLHIKFAKALLGLAKKQNKAAEFFDQLTGLADLLADKELVMALERMAGLEQTKLLEILKKSFSKDWSEEMFNLLILLIGNRQVGLIPEIKQAYQKFYFEEEQIVDFLICSSRELSADEKVTLVQSLGENKKIHATFAVDPGLIGGIQIYENGRLTDFSLKNQLEHLRRVLLGEHIV